MEESLFHKRLAETIAWCSRQTLESDPPETEEFQQRKQLERQGSELYRRAQLLEKKGSVQSWLLSHLRLGAHEDTKEMRHQGLELMRTGDVTAILPLNDQLRTPILKPVPFTSGQTNRVQIVEELAEKRAELLRQKNSYPNVASSHPCAGKLLVYAPDENVEDGASQHATKGYFDGCDVPPWDTWVFYSDPYLISWAPPLLVDLVGKGIAVNAVDCIRWADEGFLERTLTKTS